ncbi:unnamed protein product [Plutella xylostella]|uniref:Autophagy-related protein 2 n=1 Tax=Plutella xylostella TaxID=51655 RepID=A0A8S4G6C7_PLUXY|nr:unnamed protein product [Plutella xylostella]
MSSAAAPLADTMMSSVSSMTTSATSSVHVPAAQPRTTRNRKVPQIDGDPTAEVSHINIKISSCTCILLHKDILVPVPLGTDCVTPSSAKKMEEASTEFFGRLGPFSLTGHSKKDLEHANEIFDNATGRSHLRLITSALTLDGSEKTTSSGSQTACEASVTHLLLRECLYKEATDLYTRERPDSFDLIKFVWPEEEDDNESASTTLLHPNVRINFKQTLKYIRISGEKKLVYPTTDISIKCMPFTVDVELTILERMSAQVFAGSPPAPAPPSARAQLNVNMQCASVDAVLRFPIADLRPGISRATRRVRPDYLQFGFQDVVVSCSQTPSARPLPTTVTVRATTLDAYYYENETAQGIHIARANMDETYDPNILKGPTTTLPTISLTFQPSKSPKGPFDPLSDDEQTFEPASNPMTTSMHIMNNLRNSSQPTPFSNKKTAHQSITKHEDTPQGQAEELIVPGNEEEMAEFTSNSVERASIHLDLNLPILSLQLESKQLYEIIYNRINSDLLLWEPVVGEQYEISPHMAFAGAEPSIYPAFSMCKNAGYDSDSASTSSDEENLYYSAYESKMKQHKLPTAKPAPEKKETHNFCLTLKIDKGLMTIYTPYRDANKLVVPGQMGTLVVEARALTLCSVSGLGGVPHTARMCLRASQATLYHDAVQSIPSEKPPLRLYGTSLPLNLKETIYPSAKGVMLKEHVKKDMLSLALKVEPQPDLPNFKKICMTLGIEHATLRHRGNVGIAWLTQLLDVLDVEDYNIPGYQPSTVLTELHVHVWDCAIDYRPLYLPIRTVLNLGSFSVSSNVIAQTNTSSLRFLAQECCLSLSHTGTVKEKDDDKPPDVLRDYVCVIDLGLFELSLRIADKRNNTGPRVDLSASNNVVNFHTCWDSLAALCRLITYLAGSGDCQQPPAARAPPADPHTLVGEKKHYIVNQTLRLVRAMPHRSLFVYCSFDAPRGAVIVKKEGSKDLAVLAAALCRLITYLAGGGDCQQPPAARAPPADPHTLVGLEDQEEIRELSPSEIQQVNDLMAEAMKESPNTTLEEDEIISSTEKEGVEIFFFPDESNMPKRRLASESLETEMPSMEYEEYSQGVTETAEEARPTNANVANELGDPSASPKPPPQKPKRNKKRSTGEGSNTDDEYCIIESSGCSEDELAEPTVRWFGSQPVPFIEKHFTVPAARSDVLKAPRSFPPPELRYTLCEMSVVWHLFGGNDFKLPGDTAPSASSKKNVTINEGDSRQGSPKTNKRTTEYEPYEAGRAITQAYRQSGVRWSAGSERVTQRAPSEPLAAWRTRGGPGRDQATNVAVSLSKIKFQHETYPAGGTHAARQTLAISKIEVLDRLEKSHINKLLSQYVLKDEPERKNAHMLVVKAVHLRPMPGQGAEECCLKVSLLPLKFNVDQDTLSFLMAFCTKLGAADHSEDDPTLPGMSSSSPGSRQTTPTHRAPVMSVGKTLRDPPPTPTSLGDADALSLSDAPMEEPLMEKYQAERLVSENLIQLEEDFQRLGVEQPPPAPRAAPAAPAPDAPLYLRRVVFSPEVPIRLDYVGKRVDLSAGPVAGLLMGLGQLNCSELRLKRLYHRHGLLGVERLVKWAIHEWLSDIKRHQLPGLLSGIGPMHSLLQFVTGIRDLLWLPVEQWRRDGRLVHGLRRGAASFTARTAVAAIDITQRILHLIQATAETAFDMLTPGPTLQLQDAYDRRTRRRQRRRDPSRHPNDIREGVASAYQVMKEGFAETAATITIAARSESGVGVLRHLPGAAVSPLALAAAGAADVLGGVRASLAPTAQRDHKDKYRHSHAARPCRRWRWPPPAPPTCWAACGPRSRPPRSAIIRTSTDTLKVYYNYVYNDLCH